MQRFGKFSLEVAVKKGTSQYKNVAKLQESLVERIEFDKRT